VGLDSWTDQSEDFSAADAHWSWALNLGWSLFDGGLRLSQQAERRAMARAADLRTEWAERQVALDLALATTALESAKAGLARAEVARQAARRNAEESAELYRQGLVRALEVTDAAVQLFEAEVEHTKAQVGQAQAWLQLQARQGLGPVEGEFPEERR
jgi:outer membrane protein TolC